MSHPIALGISDLVARSSSALPLVWWRFFLGDLACQKFPMMKGVPKSSEWPILSVSGSLLPALFFLVSWRRRSRQAFDHPKISKFYWGFSEFPGRNSPHLQVTSREICTFPYAFLISWRRRCWWDVSLLSYRIFSLTLSPHVLWGVEDRIKVIQEIVSNFLQVFYYRITVSRSDFAKFRTHELWLFCITRSWCCLISD